MARPDVFDSLNALTGMQGDQAQSDFEQAPLPYETPAMTQGRVAQGQQQRVQYGRMKAEDLASRGIPYDTSGRGNVSEITDATGAPLSNADKTNKIAYDSAGKPVDYSQRDPTTGKHVLTDPYANVPDWTEPTTGNVYRRPKGLPWVQTGTDPAVTQQIQAKVNAQTATALAPVEQQAKGALKQATKAVDVSAAKLKADAGLNGFIGLNQKQTPEQLRQAAQDNFTDAVKNDPEANKTAYFGLSGTLTPEAESKRKLIAAQKDAVLAAINQHQAVFDQARQAQAQLDQIQATRKNLQGDKMAELNRRRVAVGLDPINIGGNQAGPSVADVQQQGATLDTPGAPTPVPSPAAPEASPSPTVAAAQPANPTQSPPAIAPTVDLSSVAQQPDAAIQTQAAAATQKSLAALPAPPKPGAPDFWDTNPAPAPGSGVPRYETDPHFGEDKPLNLVDKPNPNALSWSAVQAESADPIGLEHAKEVYPIVKATAEAPLIDLPKPENKGVVSGIARGAESTVEGMATLENALAGMGIGAASPIVQKLAAGGFSAMMLKNAVDTIGDASHAPTAGERAEGYTQAVLQLLLGALSGKHAFGRDRAGGGAAAAAEPNSEPFQRTFNEPPEEPQGPAGLGPSPNEPSPPSQPSPNAPNLALPQPPVSEPVSPAANEPATGNELAVRQQELASMAPKDPMRPLVELQVKQLTEGQRDEPQPVAEQPPSVIADESQVPAPVPEGTAQPPEASPSAQSPAGEIREAGEASPQIDQGQESQTSNEGATEAKSNPAVQVSSTEATPEAEPAQEPTPKAKKPVASPTKSAEVLPPAAKSFPDAVTLNPHEVLNDAKNVKLTPPKGARFLRVTDSKGRQIVEPIENVTKGANVFHQAGPFKRVEAGVLNSAKKFVPVPGDLTATDANKPAPEPPAKQEQAPVTPTKSPEAASVEKLANAALALHKDSLTALGHPHAFETGETRAGSGIETDVQSQRIRIDPEKLAEATKKMTPAVRAEFVKRAVAQEVIHVGTLKYAAESAANRQKLMGLTKDEELMKRAADAYGPEWKDQSDFAKAAEAARMLLEGPEKLTEASYKFLKDFLEWMKSKLKNLSKDAREVLDGIRQKLGTYEKERSASETKEQAPPETSEKPATPADIRAEITKLKADGDPEGLVPGLERYLAKKEAIGAANPEDQGPFYSQLTRTVQALPQDTMTVGQAKAAITKGAKPDEIKASGILDDPLSPLAEKDANAKVTKREMEGYAVDRQTKVQDVTLGQPTETKVQDFRKKMADKYGIPWGGKATPEEMAELHRIESDAAKEPETHFSQYQLPGAEPGSYREQFVTWPQRTENDFSVVQQADDKYAVRSKHGAVIARNLATEAEAQKLADGGKTPTTDWNDGHAAYNDIANPVVRIRRNIRTDADGKRTYFVEEMQGPQKSEQEKMPPEVRKRIYEIGMKRAIRDAVDSGADAIGWTDGKTQADRYDLSKQLDRIEYGGNSEELIGYKDGKQIMRENVPPSELENHVGKEAAKLIADQINEKPTELASLEGDQLKVGGHGIRALYDKMLPNIANKLAEKVGGKVGTSKVMSEVVPDEDMTGEHTQKQLVGIHSMDIPKAWKDEAPQFALYAATPDGSTPGPAGEEAPSGKQPSGSQPDRPSTEGALTTGEDSVAARNEKLMEEAEAAGLSPSLETIKGILRADPKAMDKLRTMIKDRTGKDAINAATPESDAHHSNFQERDETGAFAGEDTIGAARPRDTGVAARVKGAIKSIGEHLRGVSQSPAIRDLDFFDAVDEGTAHVGARSYVPLMVKDFMHEIFGPYVKDAAFVNRVGETIRNDNILGGYDGLKKDAYQLAKNTQRTPAESRELGALRNRIAEIEKAHDLDALDQQVQDAKKDGAIRGAIDQYTKVVAPEMDALYNEMKGVDADTPRDTRGRHFEARVNLLSKDAEARMTDYMDPDKPMPEMSASNYRNPDVKRDKFDRRASYTGDYSGNLKNMLTNSFAGRVNEVTKQRLYSAIEKSGKGRILEQGENAPEEIAGEPASTLQIKRPETKNGKTQQVAQRMVVPTSKVETLRRVLNTDLSPKQNPIFKALTKLQIIGVADATAHTKNQLSVVTNTLGRDANWKAAVSRIPVLGTIQSIAEMRGIAKEVAEGGPKITKEMAELAKNGMLRAQAPEQKGILHFASNFLHQNDVAARIFLSRAYDRLVQSPGFKAFDTVKDKRAFVMQIGEYNRRLMGAMESALRDYGASPFIVAGKTFNRFGKRLVAGEPGFKSRDYQSALRARAAMLTPLLIGLVAPIFLNMIFNGNLFGRKGTPIGAVDLGPSHDDAKGNRKYWDLLQVSGIRRGLRATGLDALMNGLKDGSSMNEIAGKMISDAFSTNLHPYVGPGAGAIFETATGKRLDLRQGWAQSFEARKYDGGQQYIENARAALKHLNVFGYALAKPLINVALNAAGMSAPAEKASYAGGIADAALKSPLSAFGYKEGQSPALELAHKLNSDRLPLAPADDQQQVKRIEKSGLIDQIRVGQMSGISQAVRDGTIKPSDVPRILQQAQSPPLVSAIHTMPLELAERVYAKADAGEKAQMLPAMMQKRENASKRTVQFSTEPKRPAYQFR